MSESTKRLFFALWPDDQVRDALVEWQRRCVPRNARKTHPRDFHLTLHFLGQVPAERVPELKVLGFNQVADTFELLFNRLGHFSRPRVLWAGAESIPKPLTDLHADVGDGLRELGFALESRPYRPHITLARKVRNLSQDIDWPEITWTVKHWGLVESRPGSVPLYRPLAIWPLGEK